MSTKYLKFSVLSFLALLLSLQAWLSPRHRAAQPPLAGKWDEWAVYGGGPDSIRYSSLKQINRENVNRLKIAWTFDTGDAYPGSEMQCNPIVTGGVLFATTPKVSVIALNAATGKLLWRFDPHAGGKTIGKMRNRGITYWSDEKEARIFVAVRQHLYALDAKNGKPVTSFGNGGWLDLRDGLGREPKEIVSLTTPGIIYRDLLIVGSIAPETLPAAPGDVRAYDVRTGNLRWSFHTIPRPGEYGYETWPKEAWKYTGAANNWAGMAVDTRRGLVFVPTGSAAYDFYGANRVGDNLFANCLIALKAETGERVWHFQAVRHDLWDRDFPAPPSLLTVNRDGHLVDAVAQTTKSGHVYLFERETGKPLFPIEYRKYPASDIPGEVTAETQPLPLKPEPFARQRLTAEVLTRRTPAAHQTVLTSNYSAESGRGGWWLWFDATALVAPTPNTFGNTSRTLGDVRGPGFFNLDFLLAKELSFSEHKRLVFRSEFFNAFNHFNPGLPNTQIGNVAVGTITSAQNSARSIQLSLRFIY